MVFLWTSEIIKRQGKLHTLYMQLLFSYVHGMELLCPGYAETFIVEVNQGRAAKEEECCSALILNGRLSDGHPGEQL